MHFLTISFLLLLFYFWDTLRYFMVLLCLFLQFKSSLLILIACKKHDQQAYSIQNVILCSMEQDDIGFGFGA